MIWEKHRFIAPPIYALIGWFFYVPWPEIESAILANQDSALTNWTTHPGPKTDSKFRILYPNKLST